MVWTSGVLSVTPTSGGLFNVPLQDGTPSLDTVSFDKPYYVGITVGGDPEMTPRQEMGASALSHGSPKDFDVRGNVRLGSLGIRALTPTNWGWSSGYPVVVLGPTSGVGTVSIGYDPSGNPNGSFSGNGQEVLFRNGAQFVTPNSANNNYYLNHMVLKDGKVGIGTATPAEALHVRGRVVVGNQTMGDIRALTPTFWGYATEYPVVVLGPTSGKGTVSIGYDPSGNPNGSFSGNGQEVLFRNGVQFVTPNSANNNYYLHHMVLQDGKVGIGTSAPAEALDVRGAVMGSTVVVGNATMGKIRGLTPTFWGWHASYPVVVVGPTSGVGTVSIGYDPSGNPNGSFSGNGQEVLFRNGAQFVTPNSTNNNYYLYHMVLKDGKVGIGTATPQYALDVVGTIRGNNLSPSDSRLKKNVRRLPDDSLRKLSKLNGVSFEWDRKKVKEILRPDSAGKARAKGGEAMADPAMAEKDAAGFPETTQIGLIAQEVEKEFPSLVETDPQGVKSIYYMGVTAVLVEALKAQQKQIEELTSRVKSLEKR